MRQMPKIRIHELAKELNVDNKAVMDYLKENRIEVKSHMSTLEDNQEAMVRKAFSSRPAGKEEKQEAAPKKAEAPKKKNIIQVFRPQNATTKEARNSRRETSSGTASNDSISESSSSSASSSADSGVANSQTVLVPRTGSKYHTHKCGNGTYYEATLDEALARGLTPCEKCY